MYFKSLTVILSALYSITLAVPLCPETAGSAGGGLPNGTLPAVVSRNGVREIQLAGFLKQLEFAFFTAGSTNFTQWNAKGQFNDTMRILNEIAAQEEVHLQSFAQLLKMRQVPETPPCNYSFPVSSSKEFFEIAHLISSLGVGTAIGMSQRLAFTDPAMASFISSTLAVESRHDTFIRLTQGKSPSPTPFDTVCSDTWAYNAALSFTIPGSCPFQIALPVLPKLTAIQLANTSAISSTDNTTQTEFGWDPLQMSFIVNQGKQLLIGWVDQANAPVYTALNITGKGKGTAEVPQALNGVAYAAVTTQPYDNVNDLVLGTLAGPAILVSAS